MTKQTIDAEKIHQLLQCIKDHNMSMTTLAEAVGVSRIFLSYTLHGKKKMPITLFKKLLAVIGIDEEQLRDCHKQHLMDIHQSNKQELSIQMLRLVSRYEMSDDDLRDCIEEIIKTRNQNNGNN